MEKCISKHELLEQIGEKGIKRLRKKVVFVVGAGGLGTALLLYLSRIGIKKVYVVDDDKVEETNLERQVLFGKEDLGKAKVDVVKEKIGDFVEVETFNKNIEKIIRNKEMKAAFEEADLVFDCMDYKNSKEFLFEFCQKSKKPLVVGSVVATKGFAFFTDFRGKDWKKIQKTIYKKEVITAKEKGVYSVAVGLVALMMANLGIRFLLKDVELKHKLIKVDGWSLNMRKYGF